MLAPSEINLLWITCGKSIAFYAFGAVLFGAVTVLYAAGWVFVLSGKRSLHTRKGPAEASPLHSAENRQIGD